MACRSPSLLQAGLSHHAAGRLAAAADCYSAVLATAPANPDGLHLLGLVRHQLGESGAAVPLLAHAAALRPDVGHFHGNLGLACLACGNLTLAESSFRRALALQPDDGDSQLHLGLTLLRRQRPQAAAGCFRLCLAAAPDSVAARVNLAAALLPSGQLAEAEALLRGALDIAPDSLPALAGLAAVLTADGRHDEAEDCHRTVLRHRPADAATLNNLGTLLQAQDRRDEAEACLRAALRADPGHAEALCNLGNLRAAAVPAEAEACFRAALRLRPGDADAGYGLGTLQLATGRYAEGWEGFEQRWQRRGFAPPRRCDAPRWDGPRWDGAPWPGKTLLLHAEQGLGDSLQMLRFVPALAAQGRVVLELPAALARLAEGFGAEVVTAGAPLPEFQLHCPLMSLPHALGTTLETLPAAPYLRADPRAVAQWRQQLALLPALRVGLAWAGNPAYPADASRSIAPARLEALADIPGVALVSLQKHGPRAGPAVHDWTDGLNDMADTASLVRALDLVICVDSAVAHLAGALGQPVWLLNRFDSCWRWLRMRDDSPWYPTLRQFRQTAPGDWDGVMARIRCALSRHIMNEDRDMVGPGAGMGLEGQGGGGAGLVDGGRLDHLRPLTGQRLG